MQWRKLCSLDEDAKFWCDKTQSCVTDQGACEKESNCTLDFSMFLGESDLEVYKYHKDSGNYSPLDSQKIVVDDNQQISFACNDQKKWHTSQEKMGKRTYTCNNGKLTWNTQPKVALDLFAATDILPLCTQTKKTKENTGTCKVTKKVGNMEQKDCTALNLLNRLDDTSEAIWYMYYDLNKSECWWLTNVDQTYKTPACKPWSGTPANGNPCRTTESECTAQNGGKYQFEWIKHHKKDDNDHKKHDKDNKKDDKDKKDGKANMWSSSELHPEATSADT